MGLGCFESRKKSKCTELESLAALWHLLWTRAFLHKSFFTRTLLMLFCDCLLQITPFTFNLLEMDWTFSLFLEGAHFSDGIYEEVFNQTGTTTKNWFKIIILGARGHSLATVACSSVLFVLCLRREHGRTDALRIQVFQACPQLCLFRQVSFYNTSSPSYFVGDCWIANPPSQFYTMGPLACKWRKAAKQHKFLWDGDLLLVLEGAIGFQHVYPCNSRDISGHGCSSVITVIKYVPGQVVGITGTFISPLRWILVARHLRRGGPV